MFGADRESLYRLILDLVKVPSVSLCFDEERAVVKLLHDRLAELEYFKSHGGDLRLLPCEGDPGNRTLLFALVRASRPTEETVLLMGHLDVVGVEVCGPLAPLAFDAEAYTARVGESPLSEEARRDLESGHWLFGRGVADMKTGVAVFASVLADLASRRDEMSCNVAVLAVTDEETHSTGMLAALSWLRRFQEQEGLRYIACVDGEPSIGTGDGNRASIHLGAVGKVNLFAFFVGRESHIGEYYEGLNANLMTAHFEVLVEGEPRLADRLDGEAFTPFVSLRYRDYREHYSCSVSERSCSYYSYFTATKTPGELLDLMRVLALDAGERAIKQHHRVSEAFVRLGKPEAEPRQWTMRVLSYEELREQVRGLIGDEALEIETERCLQEASGDERDKALALVDRLITLAGEKGPLAVVGFLSPFYPHRANREENAPDRAMAEAVRSLVDEAEESLGLDLQIRSLYEGVCDLSYCGLPGGIEEMAPYVKNDPGYGRLYELPLEDMAALKMPIVNLGPIGRDAHKLSERVHLSYALDILPRLVKGLLRRLGRESGEVPVLDGTRDRCYKSS